MRKLLEWLRLFFLEATGQLYWVVEYSPTDVDWYYSLPPADRTCLGGAELYFGCQKTGVFQNKADAAAYLRYITIKYQGLWPLIPIVLVPVTLDDERVKQSKWRNYGNHFQAAQSFRWWF